MTTPIEQINNTEPKGENYLLEVDNPLVIPTNLKVRFLMAIRNRTFRLVGITRGLSTSSR